MFDCRYEEGYDLDESLGWLRDEWSEQEGSEREEAHAQWLSAVKEATRQALQVRRHMALLEAAHTAAFSMVLLLCAECVLIAVLANCTYDCIML